MHLIYGMLLGTLVDGILLKICLGCAWTGLLCFRKHPHRFLFPLLFLLMTQIHQYSFPLGVVVAVDDTGLWLNRFNTKQRLLMNYTGEVGDLLWLLGNDVHSGNYIKVVKLPLIDSIYQTIHQYPYLESYFFERRESYLALISFQIRSLSELLIILKKRFQISISTHVINAGVTFWYQYLFGMNASNLNFLLRQVFSPHVTIIIVIFLLPKPLQNPSFLIIYGPLLISNLTSLCQHAPRWFIRFVLVFYSCKRLDLLSIVMVRVLKPIMGFIFLILYGCILLGLPLHYCDWFFAVMNTVNTWIEKRFTVYGAPPLICLLFLFKVKSNTSALMRILCIALMTLYNPCYTITFIDVDQGDCILIRTPFSLYTTLIDTGRPRAYPEVRRVLSAYGIQTIDQLIITHGDQDHNGSQNRVIKDYKVVNIIEEKGAQLKLLHELLYDKVYRTKNDNSLILGLKVKQYAFLFMGDASKEQERELLRFYHFDDPIFLIKLGHHGSRTATDSRFIQDLKPQFGLISSDPSQYGHPHKEVIDILKTNDVEVLETSKMGTIDFVFTPFFDYFVSNRGHFGIIGMVIR
ncbi:MBL fold metallo-hydrolase [Erysipelothrix piscisicarius]|uniref:MBL fold metallo-hydrolase n=1 Tax=Erysipelothrix piscisicarius TaxID=2485784 RepID=A0A3S8RNP4_9FIRM|nr:MBL fold metallo-hydrolase [Erysipelothrix piscisicarius]AZK44578.1 MBL fold metallo-hydrolase [Erysipelothrix piscisicarius]